MIAQLVLAFQAIEAVIAAISALVIIIVAGEQTIRVIVNMVRGIGSSGRGRR